MKLEIQNSIPESRLKEQVASFAKYFTEENFIDLRKILADDAYILLYNKEKINGADSVIDYFKDWLFRVGDKFNCEVDGRHSSHSQKSILLLTKSIRLIS